MSYLVIARKYRPTEFKDIVGQDNIIKTLTNALKEDRLGQAYLFSGTRGVGKTSLARILARALNCAEGPTVTPCNKCASCVDILGGNSIDVFEIDGASNRRVEETQQIIDNVRYAPARDRFKIYIIDEVHMLSNHAFNSLLKTLEEPPPHVVFMMATTEYHKIPQTIRSRTQHYHLSNIAQDVISLNLKQICEAEKITISDKSLNLITYEARGSMRDAQSLLDQVIAFAGKSIKDEDAEAVLGTVGAELLDRLITGIGEARPAELLELVAATHDAGHDLLIVIRKLIERIRNLTLMKIDADKLSEQVKAAGEDPGALEKHLPLFTVPRLLLVFDILAHAEYTMKYSEFSRFIMETALIKAASSAELIDIETIPENPTTAGKRTTSARAQEGQKPRITSLTPYKTMEAKESESYEPPKSEPDTAGKIFQIVEKKSKFLKSLLDGAEKAEVKENTLIIYFSHRARKLIRNSVEESTDKSGIIRDACREILGQKADFKVEEYIPGDMEAVSRETGSTAKIKEKHDYNKFTNDPVVQKLMDTFGGEITDMKKDTRTKDLEE